MRKYTVECDRPNGLPTIKHTYKGFNRQMIPPPSILALVRIHGEHDTYALDDEKEAVTELRRYLEEQEGILCAVYKVM